MTTDKKETTVEEDFVSLNKALEEGDEDKIQTLACGLFISDEGGCNWKNIRDFERVYDVRIVALERDSFGWLIGGIHYKDKVYAYG